MKQMLLQKMNFIAIYLSNSQSLPGHNINVVIGNLIAKVGKDKVDMAR